MGIFRKKVKYFDFVAEKVPGPCKKITNELKKIRKSMKESPKEKCKVILFYVPIVSRAGTDIEAALQRLDGLDEKYVAILVLHHTFDQNYIVPDSSRAVNRPKTITVDCLFHEDMGLLECQRNKEAIKAVAKWLRDVKYIKKERPEKGNRSGDRKKSPRIEMVM